MPCFSKMTDVYEGSLIRLFRRLEELLRQMAQAAKACEQAGEYEQALAKWETLRLTYRHYPDLQQHIERIKKLRDEARG